MFTAETLSNSDNDCLSKPLQAKEISSFFRDILMD